MCMLAFDVLDCNGEPYRKLPQPHLQVPETLKEMLGDDAPDVSIEAVGFHYTKTWMHRIEMTLMLETDPSEILNEIIFCTRKVGPCRRTDPCHFWKDSEAIAPHSRRAARLKVQMGLYWASRFARGFCLLSPAWQHR